MRDGARLIVDAEQAVSDVIELVRDQDYDVWFNRHRPQDRALDLAGELRRIYDAVTEECAVDDVATNACLPLARVASGLAQLELDGLVMESNGRWRRS